MCYVLRTIINQSSRKNSWIYLRDGSGVRIELTVHPVCHGAVILPEVGLAGVVLYEPTLLHSLQLARRQLRVRQ